MPVRVATLQPRISISEGSEFLGFQCRKANVLYINLEIDRASCLNHVFTICDSYGIRTPRKDGFLVWNLRGHAMPLDQLVPKIIRRLKNADFNTRQSQKEGSAAAKARGVRFGRPPAPLPENFHSVYQRWKAGKITGVAAAKECGMPMSTFRYRAEIYEKAKLL